MTRLEPRLPLDGEPPPGVLIPGTPLPQEGSTLPGGFLGGGSEVMQLPQPGLSIVPPTSDLDITPPPFEGVPGPPMGVSPEFDAQVAGEVAGSLIGDLATTGGGSVGPAPVEPFDAFA